MNETLVSALGDGEAVLRALISHSHLTPGQPGRDITWVSVHLGAVVVRYIELAAPRATPLGLEPTAALSESSVRKIQDTVSFLPLSPPQ